MIMGQQARSRVLLTGGAGYVGSQIASRLLAQSYSVRVFDQLYYGGEAALSFAGFDGFELVAGDVRDVKVLTEAARDCDHVVHMAGIVGESACNADREEAWAINRGAIDNVLAACKTAKLQRLLFVSTCSNYGVSQPNVTATEDTELNPISDYSRAKVECEALVLENTHTPATVVRLGTICGLGGRMRFDLLVSEMCKLAVQGRPIDIFGPDAWRPFLHIKDAGRVVDCVLSAPLERVARRVFNVVEANYTKRDLVAILQRFIPDIQVAITDKKPDLRDYRVSAERIKAELGFAPAHSIEDAFRETIEAVRQGYFRDPDWAGHSAVPLPGETFAR